VHRVQVFFLSILDLLLDRSQTLCALQVVEMLALANFRNGKLPLDFGEERGGNSAGKSESFSVACLHEGEQLLADQIVQCVFRPYA
jgi:hypothetical protein